MAKIEFGEAVRTVRTEGDIIQQQIYREDPLDGLSPSMGGSATKVVCHNTAY